MRFGSCFNADCDNLRLARGGSLQWSSQCRYSGVYFVSGRAFRCSFDQCKCRYYRAFNAVFSKVGRLASEEVVLDLIRNKCLPVHFRVRVEQRLVLCLYETNALYRIYRYALTHEATSDWICNCCQ